MQFKIDISRAYAKINVALHIVGRRADGCHLLDSLVIFADIADEITVTEALARSFHITGPFADVLPVSPENSVLKAEQLTRNLLKKRGITLPPYALTLHKNLPVASGIGGGSADAAATIRLLLKMAEVVDIDQEIMDAALTLGADVPVCLTPKTCRMQGIGDIITPVTLALPPAIVLINPLVPLVTKSVFSAMKPESYEGKPDLDPGRPASWRNDLKPAAITLVPAIGDVLAALQSESAFEISDMSGSGATCFGLAQSLVEAEAAAQRISAAHPDWWIRVGRTLNPQ